MSVGRDLRNFTITALLALFSCALVLLAAWGAISALWAYPWILLTLLIVGLLVAFFWLGRSFLELFQNNDGGGYYDEQNLVSKDLTKQRERNATAHRSLTNSAVHTAEEAAHEAAEAASRALEEGAAQRSVEVDVEAAQKALAAAQRALEVARREAQVEAAQRAAEVQATQRAVEEAARVVAETQRTSGLER